MVIASWRTPHERLLTVNHWPGLRVLDLRLQCCIYAEDADKKLHQPGAIGDCFRRGCCFRRRASIETCRFRGSVFMLFRHIGLVLHQLRRWCALERRRLLLPGHRGESNSRRVLEEIKGSTFRQNSYKQTQDSSKLLTFEPRRKAVLCK